MGTSLLTWGGVVGLRFLNWATARAEHRSGWGCVMRRYRRWTVLTIVAALAAACTALPGASDAIPSDPPSPSMPASPVPTTAPNPSPEVSPSPVPPIDDDVAPPEVMGATFIADLADGVTVLGRVGLKERLVVPARSFAFFDRNGTVIISTPGTKDTELRRVDIATGEIAWRTTVPDGRYVGSLAGETLALGGWNGLDATDVGLALVDIATGKSRILTPSRPMPANDTGWYRSALLTPSGTSVLTCLESQDLGCENSLVDVADGSTVRLLPGTTPPWIAVDGYTLTHDGTTTMGIDLATGEAVWTRTGGTFEGYSIGGTEVVSLWIVETDDRVYSLEIVDAATGRSRVISQWPASERWSLWPELSSATSAVIGRDLPLRGAWWDGRTPEAAVVDLASGTFGDRAVLLTGIQP